MLSPEAELDVIIRELSESGDPNAASHISKRDARRILARATEAVLQITTLQTRYTPDSDAIKLFLIDLHAASPNKTGV